MRLHSLSLQVKLNAVSARKLQIGQFSFILTFFSFSFSFVSPRILPIYRGVVHLSILWTEKFIFFFFKVCSMVSKSSRILHLRHSEGKWPVNEMSCSQVKYRDRRSYTWNLSVTVIFKKKFKVKVFIGAKILTWIGTHLSISLLKGSSPGAYKETAN